MKKIIIIFSILLIFPSILFAGDAWLLWQYGIIEPYIPNQTDSWTLLNALNTRNECLDALVVEHVKFYNAYLNIPTYEVFPKPGKAELSCFQSFESEVESVSGECKALLTHFVMKLTNKKGVTSELTLRYTNETIIRMKKEGKTKEEIDEYIKKSDKKQLVTTTHYEFWCLPAGVDPKTIK